jgi:uracil-DNA glycosylase
MKSLTSIHKRLDTCNACPEMCGTPVYGHANKVNVMLIGQAPGPHEAKLGKPFAHTAGRTLFSWLTHAYGMNEEELRQSLYFAAVARCFPGKNAKGGGDREPSTIEIENCRIFLKAEVSVLKPKLIIAVGKLAISEILGPTIFKKSSPLTEVIGKKFFVHYHGQPVIVVPLPHPSGISTWHKKDAGKALLAEALFILRDQLL